MNKRLMLPGALVLSGLVLRFFFTGVGYIAYALFFAAALISIMRFCKHRLTRAHREKQLKTSCQALHNAPPNRT